MKFQNKYVGLKKYKKSLMPHIPYDSFALGDYLLELPGFSKEFKDNLKPLLDEALLQYDKAVQVSKHECVLYEFDFNLKHALEGLGEVHFCLGEYRQRILDYKYADYFKLDKERKIAKQKEAEGGDEGMGEQLSNEDKWEENKNSKEELAVFNHKRASVHFLEMSN